MAILHTVNQSPLLNNCLLSCIRLASSGDGILLIEDGVYGALSHTAFTLELEQILTRYCIYVLAPDLTARGLVQKVHPAIRQVDYEGFVKLTLQYAKVQAWF